MEELKKGESYSICLSSVANLDIFPQNSPTDFTNALPIPLKHETAGQNFYLRLKLAGVCTFLPPEPPNCIRLHVSELEPQREGMGYTQCAGSIAFPPPQKYAPSFGVHVFREPPTLPLRVNELTKLRIRLTNELNESIVLAAGPPTIVWLEITTMEGDENFTISCVSHQPESFPSNTLTQFYSPLPQEMDLSGYEVALQHLVYPIAVQENLVAWIRVNDTTLYYDLSAYNSFREFQEGIARDLAQRKMPITFKIYDLWYKHKDKLGKVYFQLTKLRERATVKFSHTFAQTCGVENYQAVPITLSRQNEFYDLGKPPNGERGALSVNAPVVLMECDMLKPNVLAGRNGQLLHCVPAPMGAQTGQQVRVYEPPALMYLPVRNTPLNRIGIRFTNEKGELRKFHSPNKDKDCLIVVLTFRKIKKTG